MERGDPGVRAHRDAILQTRRSGEGAPLARALGPRRWPLSQLCRQTRSVHCSRDPRATGLPSSARGETSFPPAQLLDLPRELRRSIWRQALDQGDHTLDLELLGSLGQVRAGQRACCPADPATTGPTPCRCAGRPMATCTATRAAAPVSMASGCPCLLSGGTAAAGQQGHVGSPGAAGRARRQQEEEEEGPSRRSSSRQSAAAASSTRRSSSSSKRRKSWALRAIRAMCAGCWPGDGRTPWPSRRSPST